MTQPAASHIARRIISKISGMPKKTYNNHLTANGASLEDFYTCLLLDGNTLPYALSIKCE